MKLDLHVHTCESDGQYSPSEIMAKAVEAKLEYIAITDHDTAFGIEEAICALSSYPSDEKKPVLVPGIEISTELREEIHMLGLGIDYKSPALKDFCDRQLNERETRADRIIDFLKTKRLDISIDEVRKIAGSGSIGRPHFARCLVNHKYVSSVDQAFRQYLDTAEFHQVTDRPKPSPFEAIEVIHKAGGYAILAHPGLIKIGKAYQQSMIGEMIESGLDGIEVFYNKHTNNQKKFYLAIAKERGLYVSCGSDFHGEKVKADVSFGMELDEIYREMLPPFR